MTISTIRRATADDNSAIERAAERFCRRHGITPTFEGETFTSAVEFEVDSARYNNRQFGIHAAPVIERQWQRVFCRALGQPYDARLTIGYGYVGLRVE